jgi:saposin
VCAVMPSAVKNQCDHLVEVYGPAIVEILSRDIDPKDVCTLMQLCDSQETVLLLSQMPEDNPIVQMKEQDDYCALCQYAMTTLYQILENKDTEDEIKNALETVCRILPSSLEDKCDEYMEAYAEKIIELVLQEFTPDQICAELGLCSSPSETVEHHLTLTVEDNKCIVCEYIMSYLDGALANKTTEAEIREALDQVCEYLPGSFKDQCENFVNQYTDIIIDFLTHQITPEQVCKQIGLCAEPETNAEQFEMIEHAREIIEQDVSLPEASRPYCTLCEYAIGEMDKLITDKKNMYQIKAALDRICYELSTPIQKQCLKMIDEYTDEIIQMFVNEYTPQEVCYELGLCDPPTNEIIVEEHVSANVIPRNFEVQVDLEEKPLCVLCEFAIHVLEKETGILSNRTLDMAEHAIEMLCSYMPFTIGDKCIDFVQEYGDQIIEIIIETELNPEQICGALTLCNMSSTTWDASPVGGHICSFGPALWCQSRVHAKACGTIRHCEENGWN